ncbi:MAG TPA: hypothetical protein VF043_23595 [Ktedonobacteraceae bacterium]
MRAIRCPNCAEPLPLTARYCTVCGLPQSSPGQSFATEKQLDLLDIASAEGSSAFKLHRFYPIKSDDDIPTQSVPSQEDMPTQPMPGGEDAETHRIAPRGTELSALQHMPGGEDAETQRISLRGNLVTISPGQWQRLAEGDLAAFPVQPDDEEAGNDDDDTLRRFSTWNKVVHTKTHVAALAPDTPIPPVLSPPTPPVPPAPRREPHPRLFFWLSVLAIIAIVLGGIFGIVLGRSPAAQSASGLTGFSLQVAPSTIALGGIVTLHGTGFSPQGRVGLTRDANIPITDTGGAHIIAADNHGNFTDTVIVNPQWLSATHLIQAEDARTHKTASFTITVTGHSLSLRPPHLQVSVHSVNLGSGDQATDSATTVTLANAGGGQISWRSATTQPWLLLSPNNGTFATGQNMQVTIAGDRSNLKQGTYSADVIFSSDAGQMTLHAKINVTPLQPQHEAVLQLTPGALSFSAVDGSASPAAQVVTISNPGRQQLHWSTSSSTDDGSHWLVVAPQSGAVTSGGSQAIKISASTGTMLPGTYNGWVTFSNQGSDPVNDSPQTLFISLTIVPQCAIQASPGGLTFTGVYKQSSPQPRTITIGVTQGCSTSLSWHASVTTTKGGSWLSIGQKSGTTPAHPLVTASISGLSPGTYTGTLIFSSKSGNQTVPVTFIVARPTSPVLSVGPDAMNFSALPGQSDPPVQIATITNMGGGTLTWSASATTSMGGAWLSIAPAPGNLSGGQSASMTVTVKLLQSLTPGTYNGLITIGATDRPGNAAAGSPQSIPITFVVQLPCSIGSTPLALNFTGVVGQSAPTAQSVSVATSGTCANALNWTASTSTVSGGPWLAVSPRTGTVSLSAPSSTNIGVSLAGLPAGTYSGKVIITAIDKVTRQKVGTPPSIAITLTVQPLCTLQGPSSTDQTYSAEVGSNPSTQTFTIGVTGICTGNVTITPTATTGSGGNWLAVSPPSAPVTSGKTATFTVTVTSASHSAGSYKGTISLAAVEGSGIAITGSPQQLAITAGVLTPPALTTGPGPLTFNVDTASTYQQISIGNSGGEPLNWTAALDPGAPAFISLSTTSGTLNGGTSTSINVNVDATGLQGGSTYTTTATISAIDPITGNTVSGASATVPITINIVPPTMQLNSNNLAFSTSVGVNPNTQSITITNTGGNTLTWTVGTPSQSWLAASAPGGSDAAGQSSRLTFSVGVTGMSAGTYSATVDITPSRGNVVKVTVALTIS